MAVSRGMTIGELGDKMNVGPTTIRYYEDRGLLPPPRRASNGYRIYGRDDERRLQYIRSAQAAGLTLNAVSDLLAVVDDGAAPCCLTRTLARERIVEIDQQIRNLENLRDRLAKLIEGCSEAIEGEPADNVVCPLIGV